MIPSFGNKMPKVLWSELLPSEFKARLKECPLVYLPLGICEPHGQISAFGLDTLKAEWLCREAAISGGGIVAPSMGYHIHESGYHARWLEEVVGEENPHMTSMPPHVFIPFFIHQLRAFVNAGFKVIIVVSGHSGGNQIDLRLAAEAFMKQIPVIIQVISDPELTAPLHKGDHAGKYEISQLLFIRPDLIDFSLVELEQIEGAGGRLALGEDYKEATAEVGKEIMGSCLKSIEDMQRLLIKKLGEERGDVELPLTYQQVDHICEEVQQMRKAWVTASPNLGQVPVSSHSRWKQFEYL